MQHIRAIFLSVMFAIGSLPAWACDVYKADAGIRFCRDECSAKHNLCNESNLIQAGARTKNVTSIVNGFFQCHNSADEQDQRANVALCARQNPQGLTDVACNVYGGCKPPDTPSTPPKKVEFRVEMKLASVSRPVADFKISDKGQFRGITLSYLRNSQVAKDITTTSTSFVPEIDGSHITISAFDPRAGRDTKYVVFGVIEIAP